ncbi:DUF6232 family protein [Dactylosporangium sp. CS-047395]|uniref:DUF6232 family protein n=1 Tax=Dactylosporangium sp. CS-047395 TaxID=3239936 RepID=UPI003D8A236B
MLFYGGQDVRITHATFKVIGAEPCEYAVSDLEPIWVSTPDRNRLTMSACSGSVALAATAAFAGSNLSHPEWLICSLIAGGVCAAEVRGLIRKGNRKYELWAMVRHSGQPILLFATRDRLRFGQVRRALVRAIEWNQA